MSEPLTDDQIVEQANALCRELAMAAGYETPEGHKFHEDPNPRAKVYWNQAKVSFEMLRHTDIDDAVAGLDQEPREFAFDLTLNGSIRVKAPTEDAAREILTECFEAASMSVQSDGRLPETFEVSLADRARLYEIDGVSVPRPSIRFTGTDTFTIAMPAPFETRRVVVLSWQHLRQETIDLLMNGRHESWPVLGGRVGPDMLIVYAHTEVDERMPKELAAAIVWARAQDVAGANPRMGDPGFEYILFDRDADPRDDLPNYHEEGGA